MRLTDDMRSISRASLYEQIADRLETQILQEGFEEDEKLPSETALAEQFGVSRTVVRESLKLLKERGLVDLRNGMGSFVTKPEPENLSDVIGRMVVLDNISYTDIYEVRQILEKSACRSAALKVTREQLAEMSGYLETLQNRLITVEERRETDFAFHEAIARASGNKLLEILIQAMKNILISVIEKGIYMEGGIEDAIVRHDKIYQALLAHDPEAAEIAMQEHIAVSQQQVAKYDHQRGGF